ncbi:MAG: low molecular weight phosphotyrosine protein phosphatase [Anaerolineae bacterium]|nr:low molecular weight phosphotyrosine protein phosphatase [Anaerolineae bacterium]
MCTANICRSPVAAALLEQKLVAHGRIHWTVQSAGTWATSTRGPARFSTQLMAERDIDISRHRAQMVNDELMTQADLILCMETGHVEALKIEFPHLRERIFTLSEMTDRPYSIADPYGGPKEEYQKMVEEVEHLIHTGFARIVSLAERNADKRRED